MRKARLSGRRRLDLDRGGMTRTMAINSGMPKQNAKVRYGGHTSALMHRASSSHARLVAPAAPYAEISRRADGNTRQSYRVTAALDGGVGRTIAIPECDHRLRHGGRDWIGDRGAVPMGNHGPQLSREVSCQRCSG